MRRRPLAFEVRLLRQILLMLSVGTLGFLVYLLVVTPLEQNNDQDRLYATFREQLALATAPTGGGTAPGSPVALPRGRGRRPPTSRAPPRGPRTR